MPNVLTLQSTQYLPAEGEKEVVRPAPVENTQILRQFVTFFNQRYLASSDNPTLATQRAESIHQSGGCIVPELE